MYFKAIYRLIYTYIDLSICSGLNCNIKPFPILKIKNENRNCNIKPRKNENQKRKMKTLNVFYITKNQKRNIKTCFILQSEL